MSKILLLLKVNFQTILNRAAGKKGNTTTILILMIFIAIFFIFTNVSDDILFIESLTDYSTAHTIITNSFASFVLMISFFTIVRSTITKEKNTDFLFSLPLTKVQIVTATMLSSFIFSFVLSLIIFFPSSIIYYLYVDSNIMVIINSVICILLTMLLISGLGYLFNSFLNRFVIRFKIYKLIRLLFVILAIICLLAFSFISSTGSSSAFSIITEIIIETNVLYYSIFIISALVSATIGILIFSKYYGVNISHNKSKKTTLEFAKTSTLLTLLKKEFKMYFNSTTYIFQTIIGPIMLILGSIVLLFTEQYYVEYIAMIVVLITPALCCTSNSSISLEGQNLWILKSTPASPKIIILSKSLMNFIIVSIALTIAAIILVFTNQISILNIGLIYFSGILFAIFISFYGIYINLLLPKLDFNSEVEVVKSSASAAVSILTTLFLFSLLPIFIVVLSMIGYIPFIYASIAIYIYLIIVISIITTLLFTHGIKKFNQL